MQLRKYQESIKSAVYSAWENPGTPNVLVNSPTGSGKTVLFGHIVTDRDCPTYIIAHRQELVAQMSLTLGRYGVEHSVIAQQSTIRGIEQLHMAALGRRWVRQKSHIHCAGIDTMIRMSSDERSLRDCRLWVMDEAHHLLRENKWGKGVSMLPQSTIGLGVTATPRRADGQGLGRSASGVMDLLIQGPTMRDLVDDGMLTDYRYFAPPSTLDLSGVDTGADGDYKKKPLSNAVHKSSITGDVVEHYLKIAPGKRGITFATDIAHAMEIQSAFAAANVPAVVLSSECLPLARQQAMRDFEAGRVLQLVNVDILGEGVDVPACEIVSFARPTMSLSLYIQQCGRALRLLLGPNAPNNWHMLTPKERLAHIAASDKPYAFIVDHVGNWSRHGLPDAARSWDLLDRERGAKSNDPFAIPQRRCESCFLTYPRLLDVCPYCGAQHIVTEAARKSPEFVDGNLCELSPEFLAEMRGEHERIMGPVVLPYNATRPVQIAVEKRHKARREAQQILGDAIGMWAGVQSKLNRGDVESYKRFYWRYGVDVATARTLNAADSSALVEKIQTDLINGDYT